MPAGGVRDSRELVARALHARPEIPSTWWLSGESNWIHWVLTSYETRCMTLEEERWGIGFLHKPGMLGRICKAQWVGQQSLVASLVIQTIQMERLNNGSKQMTCSCIRLMNWLPWSASASDSALEKLKMKLFANIRTYFLPPIPHAGLLPDAPASAVLPPLSPIRPDFFRWHHQP